MSESRPAIPAELKRAVLVESGHRCAIPACRQTPVDVHHIDPWAIVKEHKFENLISLCPNCHRRVHNNEIDRKSLKIYKNNLSIINQRYCDFERRLLIWFHNHPEKDTIPLESGFEIMVLNLITDGLLINMTSEGDVGEDDGLKSAFISINGRPLHREYKITNSGREFAERWMDAQILE